MVVNYPFLEQTLSIGKVGIPKAQMKAIHANIFNFKHVLTIVRVNFVLRYNFFEARIADSTLRITQRALTVKKCKILCGHLQAPGCSS